MSEPTPNPTPEVVTTPDAPPADEPKPVTAEDVARLQAALDKERDLRKNAERSATEFKNQQRAAMTESERAVAEAEERGRMAAVSAYGERLARTEFIAEAARRNPGFDAAAVLEDINLVRFIGEDGEPNGKAIAASVARLIPEASNVAPLPPSFDGGARQSAPADTSMSNLIRQAAGRA